MEDKKRVELQHELKMTGRNLLGVEGVLNLGSFDEEKIIMETSEGMLEVKGDHLHIQQLNLDQGKVLLDGAIHSLIYSNQGMSGKGKGFFSRLVK